MQPIVHTERQTTASALQPPEPGMHLAYVVAEAGATPGSLSINYDGQAVAHFPCPPNAIVRMPVSWQIQGTNVPAGSITHNGGLQAALLHYTDGAPSGHPTIEKWKAIRFSRTDGSSNTADISTDYDVGPNRPHAIVAYTDSEGSSRFNFPATGSKQATFEGDQDPVLAPQDFLPTPTLPKANSLTLELVHDAAATTDGYVYYGGNPGGGRGIFG